MDFNESLMKEIMNKKEFNEMLQQAIKGINVKEITKAIEEQLLEYCFDTDYIVDEIIERLRDDICNQIEDELRTKLSLPARKGKKKK